MKTSVHAVSSAAPLRVWCENVVDAPAGEHVACLSSLVTVVTPGIVAKNAAAVAAGFYDDGFGGGTDALEGVDADSRGMASERGTVGWSRRGPRAGVPGLGSRCRRLAGRASRARPRGRWPRCRLWSAGRCISPGEHAAGTEVWAAAVALLAAELAFEVGRTVIVDHHLGVDTIALVAMVGALALGEELAGVVIGLMFTGGAALEDGRLDARAARADGAGPARPAVAQLRVGDRLEEVPVDQVTSGDVVVVRTGEVVPVDGTVVGAEAVVDTSTLSGEPLPVTLRPGMAVLSGSGQRRRAVRRARRPARGRERLRRAGAARRAGAGAARAVRAHGRPLRRRSSCR